MGADTGGGGGGPDDGVGGGGEVLDGAVGALGVVAAGLLRLGQLAEGVDRQLVGSEFGADGAQFLRVVGGGAGESPQGLRIDAVLP